MAASASIPTSASILRVVSFPMEFANSGFDTLLDSSVKDSSVKELSVKELFVKDPEVRFFKKQSQPTTHQLATDVDNLVESISITVFFPMDFADPSFEDLRYKYVDDSTAGFFKKQFQSRIHHLANGVDNLFESIPTTILGGYKSIASVACLGKSQVTFEKGYKGLNSSNISNAFFSFLLALNPKAKISGKDCEVHEDRLEPIYFDLRNDEQAKTLSEKNPNLLKTIKDNAPRFFGDLNGSLHQYSEKFLKMSRECLFSGNGYKKHIVSRLDYVAFFVSSLFTRTIEAMIAIVMVPLSFLTIGKVTSINNLAYSNTKFLGIFQDFSIAVSGFLDPKGVQQAIYSADMDSLESKKFLQEGFGEFLKKTDITSNPGL